MEIFYIMKITLYICIEILMIDYDEKEVHYYAVCFICFDSNRMPKATAE